MPDQNASVRMRILQITIYRLFVYLFLLVSYPKAFSLPRHGQDPARYAILQVSNPVKVNETAHMSEIIHIFKSFQAQTSAHT